MLIALSALTVAAAAPAARPEPQPAPTPAPTARAPAKPTTYCITSTYTGSRIPVKECRTREEWLDRGVDPTKPD